MSENSLIEGMIADKFSFKKILESEYLMNKYFQTKDHNKVK